MESRLEVGVGVVVDDDDVVWSGGGPYFLAGTVEENETKTKNTETKTKTANSKLSQSGHSIH